MPNTSTIVAIKVDFEINSTDKLRRILFHLEKNTEGELIIWKIGFKLFERKDKKDPFDDPLVKFDIQVDKKLNDDAEKTSKKKKLSAPQEAQLLGPGASDAKRAKAGKIPQAKAEKTIQSALKQP